MNDKPIIIKFKFLEENSKGIDIKCYPKDLMKKIIKKFCKQTGVDKNCVQFQYYGKKLEINDYQRVSTIIKGSSNSKTILVQKITPLQQPQTEPEPEQKNTPKQDKEIKIEEEKPKNEIVEEPKPNNNKEEVEKYIEKEPELVPDIEDEEEQEEEEKKEELETKPLEQEIEEEEEYEDIGLSDAQKDLMQKFFQSQIEKPKKGDNEDLDDNQSPTFQSTFHEHILVYGGRIKFRANYEGLWICGVCGKDYSNKQKNYYCNDCIFDLCLNCKKKEEKYKDNYKSKFHEHMLIFGGRIKKGLDRGGVWKCNICRGSYQDVNYYCKECGFNLCLNCISNK